MTVLQKLIEILNESQKFINDNDSKEDKYYRSGLREAIEKANKLIEKILTNGIKRKINTNPNQLSFDF